MYRMLCGLALIVSFSPAVSQSWTRITDPGNPIAATTFTRGYNGAAWVDLDGDGDEDLFVNNQFLFNNLGNGNFESVTTLFNRTTSVGPATGILSSGCSWGDYDNDGDPDLLYSSSKSFLFRNDGGFNFTKVPAGAMADSSGNRAWSGSFADFDADGNLDILLIHPAGFIPGAAIPNKLFRNSGPPDYTFSAVSGYDFLTKTAPYTVGTWSDFDLDGDDDLFIGSGPAGTAAKDYLYRNELTETGTATFTRLTTEPIATDLQDGQVWNWIDADNDGDLDGLITNYSGAPNRFYRNTPAGLVREASALDLPGASCLANSWGDLDNDGDLDVIITSEGNTYQLMNDGTGTFKQASNSLTGEGFSRGATLGDYDQDGDLDVFLTGIAPAVGLYRNDLSGSASWLKLRLTGTRANRSAIGATVRILSSPAGKPIWQLRQVSAQNSFNSHNSLELHVGLGLATQADSIIIIWPGGGVQSLGPKQSNQTIRITEVVSNTIGTGQAPGVPAGLNLRVYPNPTNPESLIGFTVSQAGTVRIVVFDSIGRLAGTLMAAHRTVGEHQVSLNFEKLGIRSSGVYHVLVQTGSQREVRRVIYSR